MKNLRAIRQFLARTGAARRAYPLIVALGLFSAMFEGVGLYLLLPLFDTVTASGESGWMQYPVLSHLGPFFDDMSESEKIRTLFVLIGASIILKNLVQYVHSLVEIHVTAKMNYSIQEKIYDRLLTKDNKYMLEKRSGDIVNTFEIQSWSAVDAVLLTAYAIVQVFSIIFLTSILFVLSWSMTAIILVGVLIISMLVHQLTRTVEKLGNDIVSANDARSMLILDSLAGLRTIRLFDRQNHERRRYAAAVGELLRATVRQDAISAAAGPLVEVLAFVLIAGIAFAALVTQPGLFPEIATFVIILHRLVPRARGIIEVRVELLGEMASIRNVLHWLEGSDTPVPKSGTVRIDRLEGDIVFDNVEFGYDAARRPALDRLSARIPAGKMTGIVGPSGAGKSTLVNLLCRQFDVDGGEIRVNGIPLPRLDPAGWRARFAVVDQHVHLFEATIRDNIAYGRLDASDEDVVDAAVRANAHDFIMERPGGYDARLGNSGVQLSGGQRQRIALARALIRNPRLLILDEATNAIDPLSETLVQQALEALGSDCTIVVVAHRATTIRCADHLVVMKEGRVVQQGTPDDLGAREGLFTEMFPA